MKWINFENILPSKGEWILAWYHNDTIIVQYMGENILYVGNYGNINDPQNATHWMPLPGAPQQKNE